MAARIFVVDDHPMIRRGISALIGGEPDLELAGQAEDAAEALRLVPQIKPDLLLTDIFLGGMNGIELVRQLRTLMPRLRVLVISMHDEDLYAERALEVGAMGYVMKSSPDDEILTAIRRILQGHFHLSGTVEDQLLRRMVSGSDDRDGRSPLADLSNRQLEVFELLGHGHSTTDIAARLYISRKTVESHTSDIKQKLGLRSANELLRHAIRWVEGV